MSDETDSVDLAYSQYLLENFSIYLPSASDKQEMLLVFKENLSFKKQEHKYVHQQYSNEISFASILQTFETNKFLSPSMKILYIIYCNNYFFIILFYNQL